MKRYCLQPFENAEIHLNGDVYICCPSWQKTPIGNLNQTKLEELWNGETAKQIRESIFDESYRFCDKNICPYIQNNTLKTYPFLDEAQKELISKGQSHLDSPPTKLMLNYDPSCNLSCESCRSEKISFTKDSNEYESLSNLTDELTEHFFKNGNNHNLRLNITGSGDPFASQVFRNFLEELDGSKFPNLKIDLQTNGVLFTPIQWERIKKIQKNIAQVIISVDAFSKDTYLKIRKGGNFEQLNQNIKFLVEKRKEGFFDLLQVNMVVQNRNYFEMVDFAKKYLNENVDCIYFSLVDDWGSWSKEEFLDQKIWDESHVNHSHFLQILRDPCFNHYKINLGNLTQFVEKNKKSDFQKLSSLQKFTFAVSNQIRIKTKKVFDIIRYIRKYKLKI